MKAYQEPRQPVSVSYFSPTSCLAQFPTDRWKKPGGERLFQETWVLVLMIGGNLPRLRAKPAHFGVWHKLGDARLLSVR
jgi:hypothetical protein